MNISGLTLHRRQRYRSHRIRLRRCDFLPRDSDVVRQHNLGQRGDPRRRMYSSSGTPTSPTSRFQVTRPASAAAALWNVDGTMTVTDSTISGNSTWRRHLRGTRRHRHDLGNSAGHGGGIYNDGTSPSPQHDLGQHGRSAAASTTRYGDRHGSTISGNSAWDSGGISAWHATSPAARSRAIRRQTRRRHLQQRHRDDHQQHDLRQFGGRQRWRHLQLRHRDDHQQHDLRQFGGKRWRRHLQQRRHRDVAQHDCGGESA